MFLTRLTSRIPSSRLSTALSLTKRTFATGDEIPVQFMHGEPNPVVLPRSEYPDWLFKITDNATYGQLEKKIEEKGFDSLELEEQKRFIKLESRRGIKDGNEDSST
ncbi:hypothetical protein TL16_g12672 [Triparma laevis f. inornata]|uniref:Uncharacterized protein n=2 Tax=Triparma laevis TaxID=1534972 RepID=A0A9W7FU45_9STRA|nr:hypothetical protein TL16_g12672 [Triparma laevis f. inornata]GMI17996.1 hypothetical protein TrLO_g9057 [Triparma laevis f. longispina]